MRSFPFYSAALCALFALSGCATTSADSDTPRANINVVLASQPLDIRPVTTPSLSDADRLGMADRALALGEAKAALSLYQSLAPSADRQAGIALAKSTLGQSDDIEVDLNAALENNLSDVRLWNALGRFYDGQDRFLEAQDAYISAMKAGAPIASAINNMGMSLLYEGRYNEALDKFDQANALAPQHSIFDNNRRLILALKGDYAAAISDMSELRGAKLYNDAGYLAMRRGEIKRAHILLTRALTLSPIHFAQAQSNLDALEMLRDKS